MSEDNMNVIPCSINTFKGLYDISGVGVGQHLYWQIGGKRGIERFMNFFGKHGYRHRVDWH